MLSKIFSARARRFLLAASLAAVAPALLTLSGCSSEAPKLGSQKRDEQPQSNKPSDSAAEPRTDPTGADLPKSSSPPKKVETVPVEKPGGIGSYDKPAAGATDDADPGIVVERKSAEAPAPDGEAPTAPAPGAGAEPPAPPPPPPAAAPAPRAPPVEEPTRGLGAGGTGTGGGVTGMVTICGAPTAPPRVTDNPVDPNAAFDVVPVYYGTDRAVQPDPKRLQFGAERGRKLQLGRALITVPKAHKVPEIERPWVIEIPYFKVKIYEETEDPNKHFTLQEIAALTKEQLLAYVKERLAKSKSFKDHAFIFVHGFNTSFDYALYRTAQISYDMNFDGAPFVYSWPSGGKVASYTYDRGSAEQAEPHLAEFINLVVKESGAKSVSLIAHSMGNELLLRVLERLRPTVPQGVEISQVILAAPDVDRDKFDIIVRQITNFSKGVTLYAASNDKALSYSARFWGGIPRAGDVPASGPMVVPGVDTIDVTAISTDSLGLNHSGYAENNTLLADIKLLLMNGTRPPDKRVPTILKLQASGGGEYWKFPPPK